MVQHTPDASQGYQKAAPVPQRDGSPPAAQGDDPAGELAGHEARAWEPPAKAGEGKGPGTQAAPVGRAQNQPTPGGATGGGSGGPGTDADPGLDRTAADNLKEAGLGIARSGRDSGSPGGPASGLQPGGVKPAGGRFGGEGSLGTSGSTAPPSDK